MKSKKHIATVAAAAALAVAGVTATAFARDDGRIKSDKMIGVPAGMIASTGQEPSAASVAAALPWSIGEAEVSVKSSGKVEVEFQDLVLPGTRGLNPVGSMAVVVSCLDAFNQPVNVDVGAVRRHDRDTAADPGGDADVKTSVDLPSPCFAPIVFIVNLPAVPGSPSTDSDDRGSASGPRDALLRSNLNPIAGPSAVANLSRSI